MNIRRFLAATALVGLVASVVVIQSDVRASEVQQKAVASSTSFDLSSVRGGQYGGQSGGSNPCNTPACNRPDGVPVCNNGTYGSFKTFYHPVLVQNSGGATEWCAVDKFYLMFNCTGTVTDGTPSYVSHVCG
jgi:hypothetical protein